jgi:sigma-54 dependent transcriptional regulator, acetoin dehydrogenase operon transcriptional activator AcoR
VNLRMIFSTNVDLESLLHDGLFDDELYYRITENSISIPPLREHKASLHKQLVSSANFFKEKYNKMSLSFDAQAFDALLTYNWPGNGKELNKAMDFIVSRCTDLVTVKDLSQLNIIEIEDNKFLPIRDMERESIVTMLASIRNKDDVANRLGISRATLYRKIKKYNL